MDPLDSSGQSAAQRRLRTYFSPFLTGEAALTFFSGTGWAAPAYERVLAQRCVSGDPGEEKERWLG